MPTTWAPKLQHIAMSEGFKGISAKQVLALTVTNGCQGVMLTMPFTVAVYMVRSFLQEGQSSTTAVDEQLVGQLTGTLAAVYSFTQFTTSYAWGVVSNRIGRKPIMVLGSFISTAGLLWFGLAGSYRSAAAARAVAGLLNGIIVAWKCMLGESCDSLTQGRVMSYMSLAWGVGCIAGPTIGGVLSQPCNTWPGLIGCGEAGILRFRPYFLPCAVAAAASAISLTLNMLLLEETLPAILIQRKQKQQQQFGGSPAAPAAAPAAAADIKPAKQQVKRNYQRLMSNSASPYMAQVMRKQLLQQGANDLCQAPAGLDTADSHFSNRTGVDSSRNSSSSNRWSRLFTLDGIRQLLGKGDSSDVKYSQLQQQQQTQVLQQQSMTLELGSMPSQTSSAPAAHLAAKASVPSTASPAAAPMREDLEQQQQQEEELSDSEDAVLLVPDSSSSYGQQQQQQQLDDISEHDQHTVGLDQPTKQANKQQQQQEQEQETFDTSPWYKQRPVVLSLLGYGNTCLLFCALDELTPMFASAPIKQGGLSLQEVQLAGPLAFGGLCLMLISLLAYPPLQRKLGTLPLTRIGLVLAVITAVAIPSARFAVDGMDSSTRSVSAAAAANIGHLTRGVSSSSSSGVGGRRLLDIPSDLYTFNQSVGIPDPAAVSNNPTSSSSSSSSGVNIGLGAWAVLYIAMLLKAAAGCAAFTGSMILVNSLPSPEQLGQVNGVGQSLASLARGIGPALGGILWGATVHVQWPGAQMLPYAVVACSAVGGWVLYQFIEMPDGVEAGRQQQQGSSCCQE